MGLRVRIRFVGVQTPRPQVLWVIERAEMQGAAMDLHLPWLLRRVRAVM
jgi:hypothetical protein